MSNNKIVTMVVEIPKGCTNKYEYDLQKQTFILDRPLYGANFYPGEYGFIPKTLDFDGDPLDIISLVTYPTFAGCQIDIRILGGIAMIDGNEIDTKIFGVVASDPRFAEYQNLNDIPEHLKNEITNFFLQYKALQKKEVVIKGWLNLEQAIAEINTCTNLYQKYHDQLLKIDKKDLVKKLAKEQHQ